MAEAVDVAMRGGEAVVPVVARTVDAAKDFHKQFEAAQTFNIDAKAGKTKEELTWAEAVDDEEEKADEDIDTNKTADVDGE